MGGNDADRPRGPDSPPLDAAPAGRGRGPAEGPGAAELGLPESVPCPFCGGAETELYSAFGSALSVVTYWCRQCHTAFEWIKR